MTKEEIIKRINDLPNGGITTKKIKSSNGKIYEYYFLQWSENGKQYSKTINKDDLKMVKEQLEERKKLEASLRNNSFDEDIDMEFNTHVIIGKELKYFLESIENYNK
jgi:hypothetical protein